MTKFLFWPVLLAMVFSFVACSEDDNDPSSNELVGIWQMESLDYSGTSTTTIAGQSSTLDYVGEAYDIDLSITFGEDPNEYKTSGGYTIRLTYELGGQTIEENVPVEGFLDNGTWEQNGSTLNVINGNGDPSEATIVSVDANSLVISSAEMETTTEQGVTTTIDVESIITFSRQ
jgi:hypothetical protein